ncbi:MAG: class I SAM-dependent rRNA methyltransferase [Thermodesulfobacteriota bacterium]|jgi:23S rRNA (cytosine1962-C5)-methyltransferase|nr:class I SAM-dependent rRNA methyltransferase [Thermodesulfobacteriota bacterium]
MLPSVVVGPETVRMLELGHPWVIADRYTRRWPKGCAGDLVLLTDEKGRSLGCALRDPGDRVVARVISEKAVSLDQSWFEGMLRDALMRRRHADLGGTTAYRLVNGEGDGLSGVVIECYGDFLLIQLYTQAWEPYLDRIVAALVKVVGPRGIYLKTRPRQTRKLAAENRENRLGRHAWGERARFPLTVRENGLNFLVDLQEGLHTGLFMDQRHNRADLMKRIAGAHFLNLFCFTGAFSVAAAAAGAEHVVSVDASAAYLDWAKKNFRANGLDPQHHEFIAGDCFAVLADAERENRRFDVILMDPPSFSTTRSSRFTTRGGTSDLVASTLRLLSPGGLLICSSNHQKVDWAEFLKEIRRGALQAGSSPRVLSTRGQPEDFPFPVTFPEGRYLKYVMMEK